MSRQRTAPPAPGGQIDPPAPGGPAVRPRNYCRVIDPARYGRNAHCRLHDNAYGIAGGGGGRERRLADGTLRDRMRADGDPAAWPAWAACRLLGWFFFNYHPGRGPWRGQLVRRFARAPE